MQVRDREHTETVSLAGHFRGTGGFSDVALALRAWEQRRGYRDESGLLLSRHSWNSQASAQVAEIAQKNRQRRARA